ncbi:MAG TPA: aminotransferase class I/II-fold pyridoxal phosphate-dependent enzyme [Candidatus Mediterraneibacter norfolkensis]|nr:aminotransferase class I/II-fold pyridoxal phosphate-dependent enzyme [Candidatus Mediterraneibacter norfolkensis]
MEYLYDKLMKYSKSDFYPLHMPGHKRNRDITGGILPYAFDITEIEGFDDLHHASGILLEAQSRAASIYHAEETHFLINGSTAGLLSAVLGSVPRHGRILMARNCHKSVYNAVYMGELHPLYVYPKFDPETELNGEILPEDVESILEENPEIQAVVITSPTYDGVVSDVERIAQIVHRKNIPLIVDEAHGAHFGFHPYFPENSNMKGADIVIHSLHKTMPSLTQTALLHINGQKADRENIRRYLHMIQTSSPSYILMTSMDECIRMVMERGEELFKNYAGLLKKTRAELAGLKKLRLIESGDPEQGQYDRSKIVISGKDLIRSCMEKNEVIKGFPAFGGRELYQVLIREYHIQPEMAAGSYIVAMTGPGDTEAGLRRFVNAVMELDGELEKTDGEIGSADSMAKKQEIICTSWEAELLRSSGMETEMVPWEDAAGRIAMEFVYLYPPGIPLIVPGEKIGRDTVAQIKVYAKKGFTIGGTRIQGKTEVMKNEENILPDGEELFGKRYHIQKTEGKISSDSHGCSIYDETYSRE